MWEVEPAMKHRMPGDLDSQEANLGETDDSLAARAASDPAALAELYRRHAPGIYQYCRYRLHDLELAQDVMGEIFLKMVQSLRTRPVDRFRPWLYTIAHHEVVTAYRRMQRHVGLDQVRDYASPDRSPEEIAVARGATSEILALLPQLKPNERDVFGLRLAGLTNQEICTVLNKSHPWVRTTQHRAVCHLQALLAEGEGAR